MGNKSGVKAFRSEVDILRNVIRKNVNEIVKKKFGDIEDLRKRQELIEKSLKSRKAAKSKASAPDMKPLMERMSRLESDVRAAGKRTPAEKGIKNMVKKGDIERVLGDMVESRLNSFNKKMLALKRETDTLKGEFQRDVGSLKSEVAEVAVDGKGMDEVFKSDIGELKRDIENVKELENHLKSLNLKEIMRDLEIIKTKQEWAENNIERIDMKPLMERMSRLESDVRAAGKRTPAGKGIRNMVKKGDIERVLGDMVESRLSGFNNKVLMLRKEIEMLRGELESSKVRKLEGEFQRDVGSLKSQLNKVIIDGRGLEERLSSEIETLKKETGDLGKTGEHVKGLNIEELRRDLEIIKTKQEWIENNIERIDMKPLFRKMEELEHRIRLIRTSSPIILE